MLTATSPSAPACFSRKANRVETCPAMQRAHRRNKHPAPFVAGARACCRSAIVEMIFIFRMLNAARSSQIACRAKRKRAMSKSVHPARFRESLQFSKRKSAGGRDARVVPRHRLAKKHGREQIDADVAQTSPRRRSATSTFPRESSRQRRSKRTASSSLK